MTSPTIYTSPAGERRIRDWCRDRLRSWTTPHRTRTLETGLGSTTVVVAGRGPGVLLLPGTNFCAATLLEVADALVPDHEVIMADLPGQPGLSAPGRPRRGRMAAYGRWVVEVAGQVSDGPVTVVGHSLGAAVALAARPGPLIDGLVLVSPAGLSRARLTPALLGVTLPWLVAPTIGHSEALLRYMSGRAHVPRDGDRMPAEWMTLVARHSRTSLAPAPLPASVVRRWEGTPVVVATGTDDRFYPPARVGGPVRALLGGETVAVPGMGHLGPHEDPELLPALLGRLRAGNGMPR
ncbi:alpha/beta hydrolase [Streptosporangium sp. NPDC023615]|uniref:alpha/beta fold hydrolase n=1 Tax=Streptosporangium sp. NPDC023615 TaxID=3154794 RepID=UPI003445E2E4